MIEYTEDVRSMFYASVPADNMTLPAFIDDIERYATWNRNTGFLYAQIIESLHNRRSGGRRNEVDVLQQRRQKAPNTHVLRLQCLIEHVVWRPHERADIIERLGELLPGYPAKHDGA